MRIKEYLIGRHYESGLLHATNFFDCRFDVYVIQSKERKRHFATSTSESWSLILLRTNTDCIRQNDIS